MSRKIPSPRTALYRLFNADDELLYVGITVKALSSRMDGHGASQPWWPEVHHATAIWYETYAGAAAAETAAILAERPRYNIKDCPTRELDPEQAKRMYIRHSHRQMTTPLPGLLGHSPYELRVRRFDLRLTQAQAAKLIGVSMTTFQGWEAGKHAPSPERLRAYFKLLGLPVEDAA